jgi:TrmH family RNA methyltransferase
VVPGRPDSPDLTNPRSERVRWVRSLAGRPARLRHGAFLVEGPQGVLEAVRWTSADVRDVYLSRPALDRYPEIAHQAGAAGVRVRVGSTEVLEAMSADAQGVLAVLRVRDVSLVDVAAANPRLVAVLVAVRDPGNAGTIIRTADAAGADAVVLTDTSVDVHNPKVVRATAGSFAHLPIVRGVSLAAAVAELGRAGLAVLAADGDGPHDLEDLLHAALLGGTRGPRPTAPPDRAEPGTLASGEDEGSDVTRPDLGAPSAWLFGNEAQGLGADALAPADAVVRIPIHGRAESLNVATAAGLCLYASAHAQRRTGS